MPSPVVYLRRRRTDLSPSGRLPLHGLYITKWQTVKAAGARRSGFGYIQPRCGRWDVVHGNAVHNRERRARASAMIYRFCALPLYSAAMLLLPLRSYHVRRRPRRTCWALRVARVFVPLARSLEGYRMYTLPRTEARGDGVACFVKRGIEVLDRQARKNTCVILLLQFVK